ncbi:filaggrin-2-like [Eupeodes corollae]|uniref:filaggrin-2-like n=1 Tax=Eupeodes corollae TaxID=290404 RepID=UPI002491E91D|nr:filaggrin-2-like [Eupeodes corollae]
MIRLVGLFLICCLDISFGSEHSTESPNSLGLQGYSKNNTKDGLTKRGIQVENLSRKSYDPPPEYYRGSASSLRPSTNYNSNKNNDRDNIVAEYSSRPVAFPQENYGFKGSSSGSWSNTGQHERKGQHDRISVEHYGTASGHSGYGEGSNHGYSSNSGAHPYGPPQAIEYEYYTPTTNSHGYSEGGEGIPVELYNRGYGGYGHAGEYATYAVHPSHHAAGGVEAHGGHVEVGPSHGKHGYDKALLAKSFLIPLASAAVLGIAAALASNPLLLQLGTVSGIGKRKKRELDEKLVMHSRAYRYRSHRRN